MGSMTSFFSEKSSIPTIRHDNTKRYFVSFSHKLLPTGKVEFQNCVIMLDCYENFSVREIEKVIQKQSNLNDVSIISFQQLKEGET